MNLAAEHRDDVEPKTLYDEVNVEGARNVVAAAESHNITRLVFTSSVAIYGFAPVGTDETGEPNPFNDYGRTKWEAEKVYRRWQTADPSRTLFLVRPTVVFGERNRGNVYNVLTQLASGRFPMVGAGTNRKSMAYVENVAAFLQHGLSAEPGLHVYNYVDQPDFDMNTLIAHVDRILGRGEVRRFHWPYFVGFAGGLAFDLLAKITGKPSRISSIRVKKFCSDTVFSARKAHESGFRAPVPLAEGLERTIRFEFLEDHSHEETFETE